MVHEILIWPDPILQQKAAPVATVDADVRRLVDDLFETMYDSEGVGLAATQIGVLRRVLVLDLRERDPKAEPLTLINPEIVFAEGKVVAPEACLSVPGESEDVERAERIRVRYLDVDGKAHEVACDGLLAVAIQHETDHLDGTVYVDRISVLKRQLIRGRMKRIRGKRAKRKGQARTG